MCLLTKSKPPREGSLSSPYLAHPREVLTQEGLGAQRAGPLAGREGRRPLALWFVFSMEAHTSSPLASLSLESRNAPILVCFPRCCIAPIRVRLAVSLVTVSLLQAPQAGR